MIRTQYLISQLYSICLAANHRYTKSQSLHMTYLIIDNCEIFPTIESFSCIFTSDQAMSSCNGFYGGGRIKNVSKFYISNV